MANLANVWQTVLNSVPLRGLWFLSPFMPMTMKSSSVKFRPLAGIMVLISTKMYDIVKTFKVEDSVPLRGLWFLSQEDEK